MKEIFVVHPACNLVKLVAQHLLQRDHLSEAVVVFPHRRPAVFLEYYLAQMIDKPCFLPYIKSFEDWIKEIFARFSDKSYTLIDDYDQAWLAYLATQKVFEEKGKKVTSWAEFFPWALRLIQVFKEFDLELSTAQNLYYPPEGSLPPKAIEILENLGSIYKKFNHYLKQRNFITLPKMLRFLAEKYIPEKDHTPIYLVGFYSLSKAEEKIFKKLYEKGAYIYWHAVAEDLPEFYKSWRKNWKASLKEISPQKPTSPEIFFFEAHDLHSELKELTQRLPKKIIDPRPDQRAIILLSSGSLIPLTHHLPEGPVNLTMGYPLRLTGLFTFLQNLWTLVLEKDEKRGYPLEPLLTFLKSPYIEGTAVLEKKLQKYGAPFISKEKFFELIQIPDDSESYTSSKDLGFIRKIFEEIIFPLEKAQTPADLSLSLRKIFRFLQPEKNFGVFEKEFLVALLETVFPILENSLFSQVPMDRPGLSRFFEELISSVRVPFEGEPLCGLQVMGLLEARILSFEEVFFLDVNEGVLPDIEEVNPLLPQQIRKILGLPPAHKDEAILRYHFERLLKAARKVHIFWQLQTTKMGEAGLEGKKIRSRYVEKLLWEIEKKEGRLFLETNEAHRFKTSSLEILPAGLSRPKPLKKDEKIKQLIRKRLFKISPSLLGNYLDCPLKFFYSQILALPPRRSYEELDYSQLGTAVHEALEDFFREVANNSFPSLIRRSDLSFKRLFQLFEKRLESQDFFRSLSLEKRFLLLKGAEFRLKKYLENHPEKTIIIELEEEYSLPFEISGKTYELFGKIDRIDKRDHIYIILDYKTGNIKGFKAHKVLGLDTKPWLFEKRFDDQTLVKILDHLPDIQLPFYIYLFLKAPKSPLSLEKNDQRLDQQDSSSLKITAAYIKLAEKGQEIYFVKPSTLETQAQAYAFWFKENFPTLVRYLIMHIINSSYWYPAINEYACKYCDYWKMCRYAL